METASYLLALEDDEGHVLFSEEDSRELLINEMTPWLKRFATVAVILFLIGITMTVKGYLKGPVEEEDSPEEESEEDFDENDEDNGDIYDILWEDTGAKLYRGNFHGDSIFESILNIMIILFTGLVILFMLTEDNPFWKEYDIKDSVTIEITIKEYYLGTSTSDMRHYLFGDDWVGIDTENGTTFWFRKFYEYVDDLDAFDAAIREGKTFYVLAFDNNKLKDEMDAYALSDESNHYYYTTEDGERAFRSVQWHAVRNDMVLIGFILLYFLSLSLTMRYADKLPSFLVKYAVITGSPTMHLANSLGDNRSELKKSILLRIRSLQKKAERERAQKQKEKTG